MEALDNPSGVLGSCNSKDVVNGTQDNAVWVSTKGSVPDQSNNDGLNGVVLNCSSMGTDEAQLSELYSLNLNNRIAEDNVVVGGENDKNGVVKSVNDDRLDEDCETVVNLVVDVRGSLNGDIQDGPSELVEVEVKLDDVAISDGEPKELFEVNCAIIPESEERTVSREDTTVAHWEQNELLMEEEEEEDHKFAVGEIVWAKTLNHPWWPGQIYDPADASKDITMYYRKDRILVAFFGDDESSAWCYPSLVKPFHKKFRQMSTLGNSGTFRNALDEAVSRIARCVELGMTCSCVSQETVTKNTISLASNSGIREGVAVPEGRIPGLSITEFEPVKFLGRLRCIAEVVSEISLLERSLYQSQLSAFNRANGWRHPQIYLELQDNSDCNDNTGYAATDVFAFDEPAGEPLAGPSLSNVIGSNSLSEKIDHKKWRTMNFHLPLTFRKRRRKKDFADGFSGDLGEVGSASCSKGQQKVNPSRSDSTFPETNNRTLQNVDCGAIEGSRTGSLSRERKKSKYLSPPYTMLSPEYKSLISLKDSVHSPKAQRVSNKEEYIGRAGGLVRCSGETIRKKPSGKKIEANVDASEILSELYCAAVDPMCMEESEHYDVIKDYFLDMRSYQYGSDEQKVLGAQPSPPEKDMYMTDHLTNEDGVERGDTKENALSNSSQRECKDNALGFSGEDEHKTSPKSSGGAKWKARDWKEAARSQILQTKSADRQVDSQEGDLHGTNIPTSAGGAEKKGEECLVDAKCQISQIKLSDIVSPGQQKHRTDAPTSENGPKKRGRKRKCLVLPENFVGPRQDLPNLPTSVSGPKKRGRKRKQETLPETLQIRSEHAASFTKGETSSTALVLNFGPGVPLPTKEDLIALFGRFGALNELETEIMKDSSCAQVVYYSKSNAEEALNSSQKINPFGAASVSYQLQCFTTSKPKVNSQFIPLPVNGNALTPIFADGPPLQFVRQNLENMTALLEKTGDKLSPEVKENLEKEIKRLLNKVETMATPSS